ncbi:acid phosphatase [Williamsia sterculiae]|uniref:acid phosphatase n=1 Tax=Williamsia sterculiae TaxID=1344003 RepID=UPI0009705C0E|nr:acid phosphatase [Williamsia sterculiae]
MGSPTHRLILIRHGETEWSVTGKHTGSTDIDLTEAGRDQATTLRTPLDDLSLVRPWVISSPRTRARRTAELADLTVDEVSDLLCEWDYGDYEGLTTPEIRQTDPQWTIWSAGAPGGESVAQMSDRIDQVIATVAPIMTDRDVVVVAHGHFSRSLLARWIDSPVDVGEHFAMLPASLAVLTFNGEYRQINNLGITGYASAHYVDAGRPTRAGHSAGT